MRFPIWAPGETVGEIVLVRRSLYWEYSASLDRDLPGFVRLYLHGPEGSSRLGLFCAENRIPTLRGRISCRSAGRIAAPFCFSVIEESFLPPDAYMPEAPLPFFAKKTDAGWSYLIPVSGIDDRTLTYLCFFTPCKAAGEDFFRLSLDAGNKPIFPEIS